MKAAALTLFAGVIGATALLVYASLASHIISLSLSLPALPH